MIEENGIATEPTEVIETGTVLTQEEVEPAVKEPTLLNASEPSEGDPKEGDPAPTEPVIPEAYDIKLMDGYELAPEVMDMITPILKKHNLSQEAAQELANTHMELMNKQRTALDSYQKEMIKGWVGEIKADPEFGGINFDKNMSLARRGLNAIMPSNDAEKKAITEILDDSGMGNNPHIIKMFARVGKMVKEDSVLDKGKSGQAQSQFSTDDMFAKSLGFEK